MQKFRILTRRFFALIKFGIVLGNVIPVIAGFMLADGNSWWLLFLTVIFSAGVISSGCVMNNYIDRDIDKLMDRTKNRPLPQGEISPRAALIFGAILGIVSIMALWFFVNGISAAIAMCGLFLYVIVYTIFAKRHTVFAVHIGSLSGAVPPLIGYAAVKTPDTPAMLLFLILVIWQIPHSFAIETFRFDDYKNAKIPTVPNTRGLKYTARSAAIYVGLYCLLVMVLCAFIGLVCGPLATLFGLYWLKVSVDFYKSPSNLGAKRVFFVSIINIIALSSLIIISQYYAL